MDKYQFTGYQPKTSDKTLPLPTKGSSAVPPQAKSDTERTAKAIKKLFESLKLLTEAINKMAEATNEMADTLDKIHIKAD